MLIRSSARSTLSRIGACLATGGLLLSVGLSSAAANADEGFAISVQTPSANKGSPAKATVVIKPSAGHHMNKEFPTNLKITAPADVEVAKSVSARDHGKVVEQEADIDVDFTAKEAGKKTFNGVVSFAVCTATTCDPRKAAVTFVVDVK